MCTWLESRRSWAGAFCATLAIFATLAATTPPATGEDVSAPAILQVFEARWETIEDRMADVFDTGYGRLWLPPPQRADSGNQSVGYDVFDRFDLGSPRNETLYGTDTSLKMLVRGAHTASVLVNTDFIANHNGFSNLGTVDTQGTPDPEDDVTFAESGGYPGFVVTLPGDIDGDFHGAFEGGEENSRLSGLIDIAQEKNHQFIRHPTATDNPQNIPAGTSGIFGRPPANVPNPNNARYYPDTALGSNAYFDNKGDSNPANDEFVTLYDFNTTTPLDGDPYAENAMGLLMRNMRWMIQEIGVDGFRLDAARHFPRWVLNYLDQAMFRAKQQTLLDGSPQHVFTFSETGYDSSIAFLESFIRKDINNATPGNLGGNRDVLDFNLFGALKSNLTDNGLFNNWHSIVGDSIDRYDAADQVFRNDDWNDGSQGVAFAQSHDELGPYLQNLAYAYILMRPGNAIVYTNAKEFGDGRDFPRGGKDDALGGYYGDTITTLVELRNTHGRGDFRERWIDMAGGFSNVYIYERENSAIVALNSRNDYFVETRSGVQTAFAPGTILVELTGNAADSVVDFDDVIPETIKVDGTGKVNISIPANNSPGMPADIHHGRGYVIYGLATPQGSLTLTNVAATLAGGTPTAATNGTTRLADIDVIHADTFEVRLNTTPVSLPDPDNPGMFVCDFDADGDAAVLRIDGGMDLNELPGVDVTSPGDVAYGFEQFTDTNQPGFTNGGVGLYEQEIDATQLAEGRHYITVRAFRHRTSGPAVFTDFKRTIYVDRLAPESEVVSFEPFASSPGDPDDRDLIVRSLDGTADNMHIFLDLPAGISDAAVLQMALNGQNDAGEYDRDQWIYGFFGVTTGNHAATVVTFEPTFDGTHGYSVRRFSGLFTETNIGAGFGDLDHNGAYAVADIDLAEGILYSEGPEFLASFDVNGDGLNDNLDLFALGEELVVAGAGQAVLDAYVDLLLKRGDFDNSMTTGVADLELLYANLGPGSSQFDVNVDGEVDADDAEAFITHLLRTIPGDYNLDGKVDAGDYVYWRNRLGQPGEALVADGDFNGTVGVEDYDVWKAAYGFERGAFPGGAGGLASVPEPSVRTLVLTLIAALALVRSRTAPGLYNT